MSKAADNAKKIAPAQNLPGRSDVFISYSRKDKEFAETLVSALQKVGRDPWIDWKEINKGEDWWHSIQRGIEEADTFVFIVSPDSVESEVCCREVEYATQCNKRFLPIVRREKFDHTRLHASVSRHNWLFCRPEDNFNTAFEELLTTLDIDLDYVRTHTRLLLRSLEWQSKDQDSSYLLRGTDLQDAQQWLQQAINSDPKPTPSQIAYIQTSLDAQTQQIKSRQKAKWVVVLTTVLANGAIVAGGLYWIYVCMINIAIDQVDRSMKDTLKIAIAGIDGDEFEALAQVESLSGQLEPLNNPLYDNHQGWLRRVQELVPQSRAVSYIPGNDDQSVIIIGDVFRFGERLSVNGEVDFDYLVYDFREEVQPEVVEMVRGFQTVQIDPDIIEDANGRELVASYGPIHNSAGESVGALLLEYDAQYMTEVGLHVTEVIQIASIGALIWFVISSWLILRATRPM